MAAAVLPTPKIEPLPSEHWQDYDSLYEIIDGVRVEIPPMSSYAVRVAYNVSFAISKFAQEHKLGEITVEELFCLPAPTERKRRPDVAFVSYDRWPIDRAQSVHVNARDVVPDLAVEVVSPSDLAEEIMDKMTDYFDAGVRQVWVIYPSSRLVYVHDALDKVHAHNEADILDGGTILPGFQLKIGSIFPPRT